MGQVTPGAKVSWPKMYNVNLNQEENPNPGTFYQKGGFTCFKSVKVRREAESAPDERTLRLDPILEGQRSPASKMALTQLVKFNDALRVVQL